MRDLNFYDRGCEPTTWSRSIPVAVRRGFRRVLRPAFVRLAEILNSLADRLDEAESRFARVDARFVSLGGRLEGAEEILAEAGSRFADVERRLVLTEGRIFEAEKRIDAAGEQCSRLETRSDGVERRLVSTEGRIYETEKRTDTGEARLGSAESNVGILYKKSDGLAAHLEGLTGDHHGLNARFESRVVQITALCTATEGLGRRQDEFDAKIESFHALHWDHLALTRRLAAIEDLLAGLRPEANEEAGTDEHGHSIPFPGLDEQPRARLS